MVSLTGLLFGAFLLQDAPRPDLVGAVFDAEGRAVEGASVFVYTAAPRRGTSPY